eukprot:snap_masked-scaffold_23-processed-gene-1.22-mRNA-1 protein AED:1.00 eAED:1.00 QI:0/0/0/0/1/1/7/0/289
MVKSIQQKYEERRNKAYFKIKWKHDNNRNPINPGKFTREIEDFVKGFQLNKEVSIIKFKYCPFDSVKSAFTRFILCFPAVKSLLFWNCRFSDENFQNFQQFKILKLNILEFTECNIPEVSSFCSLLSSINIKDIRLCENNFSAKYTNIIFKSLSFNKTIFIVDDVQNNVIVSAIKNYLKANKRIVKLRYEHTERFKRIQEEVVYKLLVSAYENAFKTNKTIESLTYEHTERFKYIEQEDIVELREIVDSHPSILSLQVYKNLFKPKKKSKCLKSLFFLLCKVNMKKKNC